MTHNGRDHWSEMNAEQRARLIRDMPMEEDDDPAGQHFMQGLFNGLVSAAVVLAIVFAFYAIAKGWHL